MTLYSEDALDEPSKVSPTTRYSDPCNKGELRRPEQSHAAGNAATPLHLRLHTRVSKSYSQLSTISIDSALSGLSAPAKPRVNASNHSLASTLRSTPSLAVSSVRSTDTMQYDNTRRKMAALVTPAACLNAEKYAPNTYSRKQLESLTTAHPLPELAQGEWTERWRSFRYGTLSAYMRLWTLAILANVASIIAVTCKISIEPGSFTYSSAATATGANLFIAALMRHEHSINLLFRLATALPPRTPLTIRRQAAKVYSYGGLHSGCGISALLWYIVYTALAVAQFEGSQGESMALAATTALTLLCLCVIIGLAHPGIRTRWHDQWEVSHRFAGWMAMGLVWAQTIVLAISAANHADRRLGHVLVKTPTFWFLIVITCCLIYPWLRLRRRKVEAEVLSSHAVRLWFEGKTMPSCVGARLSHKPLTENHGFATIPNARATCSDVECGLAYPEKAHTVSGSTTPSTDSSSGDAAQGPPDRGTGFSIVVSRAGDFTSDLIDNPPDHIWTRGAPTRGVLQVAHLFQPLVVVATGSGIGPCLSFLQVYPDHPMRVIWSARTPLQTYGAEVVDAVLRADRDAIIIDTAEVKQPGPDLAAISWAVAKAIEAEAMVIISNPFTTRKVVFALECRGFPAFGAIFDS